MICTAIRFLQFVQAKCQCQLINSAWLQRVCATCCLSLVFPCLSNANPLGDTFSWRDGAYQRNIQMDILPTRMMDDETLFLAAEVARDGHMCATQRLLNNHWLIESELNTYSGDQALNKILKMTLLKLWHLKTGNHLTPQAQLDEEVPLSFTTFDNYNLKMSGGGLKLSLKLHFN